MQLLHLGLPVTTIPDEARRVLQRFACSSPRVGAAIDKHLLLVSTKVSFCLIQ
jgi:hypothetical protein